MQRPKRVTNCQEYRFRLLLYKGRHAAATVFTIYLFYLFIYLETSILQVKKMKKQ